MTISLAGRPLQEFLTESVSEVLEAFRDIIKAHRWLLLDRKILHRHLSGQPRILQSSSHPIPLYNTADGRICLMSANTPSETIYSPLDRHQRQYQRQYQQRLQLHQLPVCDEADPPYRFCATLDMLARLNVLADEEAPPPLDPVAPA